MDVISFVISFYFPAVCIITKPSTIPQTSLGGGRPCVKEQTNKVLGCQNCLGCRGKDFQISLQKPNSHHGIFLCSLSKNMGIYHIFFIYNCVYGYLIYSCLGAMAPGGLGVPSEGNIKCYQIKLNFILPTLVIYNSLSHINKVPLSYSHWHHYPIHR